MTGINRTEYSLSIIKTNRENWVDVAKAFAIIAVVLGHINYQYPEIKLLPISTIIAWMWHVPVFFMIGGFFLKDEKMTKPLSFIKIKLQNLYLPILYLYIPFTLLHNVLFNIGFYDANIVYGGKYIEEWTTGQFIRGLFDAVFLAGREPILGAMWFVYVLFIALCYLSITSYFVSKFYPLQSCSFERARCLILLCGGIIASFLTNIFDFTIPRFNNVFTAAWLIYVGKQIVQIYKIKFDNWFVFVISCIVFYSFAVLQGDVHINRNEYDDIISLTVSSLSALYVISFIAKRAILFKEVLTIIGRNSFYIMGLHFLSFKLGTLLLNMIFKTSFATSCLNAPASNIMCYIYYAIVGIFMPLVFIGLWRKIISIINNCKRK